MASKSGFVPWKPPPHSRKLRRVIALSAKILFSRMCPDKRQQPNNAPDRVKSKVSMSSWFGSELNSLKCVSGASAASQMYGKTVTLKQRLNRRNVSRAQRDAVALEYRYSLRCIKMDERKTWFVGPGWFTSRILKCDKKDPGLL